MPKHKELWEDEDFPHERESLCPYNEDGWIYSKDDDEDEVKGWENYDWCKIDDITGFENNNYNIFEQGAAIEDIIQGDVSDCYFLSAIGSLCSYPNFFEKLFLIKNISEEHVYGIYLFLNGTWKLVLIDDYFPYKDNNDEKALCFGSSVKNKLWVSLLEKAWAKVNGCYVRIGSGGGYMNESFDVLTEAYTEQIEVRVYKNEKRENELWELLRNYFSKEYVLAAGTHNSNAVEEAKLDTLHAYTLIKIYSVKTEDGEERLIKLKNPYGITEFEGDWSVYSDKWTEEIARKVNYKDDEENYGIFYMSFSDFCKYFDLIYTAKLEPRYQTTFCKIKKNKAVKCQVIRIIIKKEKTHVYIQLYQKSKRIIRNDGTYSDEALSFLILVDKNYKYIQSTAGREDITGNHICIEANLDPGTYYIYSDVNYRNEHSYNNHGYMITFYSNNIVKDSSYSNKEENSFEIVTERLRDPIKALQLSMYYYCKMNNIECIDDENGIIIFDSKHSNKDMPFRILYFINPTMNPFKVNLTIEGKKKNFCLYNDEIASEFDTSVIKEIKPRNATSILIWENNLIDECKPVYEILDGNDTRTYESVHPIFDKEGKKQYDIDSLLKYYSKVYDGKGFILGLENTSEFSFKLNLKLEGAYDIDNNRELFGKDDITFVILPKEKRVFNAKNKSDVNGHDYSIKRID